jgi:prepilin-type N-terminal cleavage/methylation domain-containing protein
MARRPTHSRRSIPRSRSDRGFTVIELLATLGIASLAFAAASTLLSSGRYFMQNQVQRIETVQALRATIDTMTRDLRLSGACLPIPGQGTFTPITATNSGTADTITTRSGLVRPNLTCIYSSLTTDAAQNSTSLTVASTSGFQAGMGAYIYSPVTLTGQDFNIVSISGNSITSDTKMSQTYGSAAGSASTVYAVDRRTYSLNTGVNPPILNLSINGGAAMPFATGIETLNIQYRLYRNCPPCDTLDLPGSTEWPLLNEIILNVTARSQKTDLAGSYYRRSAQFIAKPRNLIPNSG